MKPVWGSPPQSIEAMQAKVMPLVKAEQEQYAPETLPPEYLTGRTLLDKTYEEKPIIGGLLDEGESLLIVGGTGIGKSLISLAMGVALVTAPNKLWGLFEIPDPVKVLFVQSEVAGRALKKRLKAMMYGDPDVELVLDWLTFAGQDGRLSGDLTDSVFVGQLERLLEETEAKVLVIDPLISFYSGDENANVEMRRALDALTALCDRQGVVPITIHHKGKPGKDSDARSILSARGASAIGDWAANCLVLDREGPTGNLIRVAHAKSRNSETVKDFYLERTPDLAFRRVDKPKDPRQEQAAESVDAALKSLGGRAESQTDLVQKVQVVANVSEPTARRWVKDAIESGRVKNVPGQGKKIVLELMPRETTQ